MGGTPKTAMNLICFPLKKMDISIFRKIIQGGMVEDDELKYGLSVTGFIHPKKILTKKNINPGDQLILTKPLGTGIINTAIKGGVANESVISKVTKLMAELNKTPAEIMNHFPVHACTDITGFGFLGHLAEMKNEEKVSFVIHSEKIPTISEALDYARMGLIPNGAYKNRAFREKSVSFSDAVDPAMQDILFDPQTSGGLLISIESQKADDLVKALQKAGIEEAGIVGEVIKTSEEKIIVE